MNQNQAVLLLGGGSVVQGEACIREAQSLGMKVIVIDDHDSLSKVNYLHLADHVYEMDHYSIEQISAIINRHPSIGRVYSFKEKLQFLTSLLNLKISRLWTPPNAIQTIQNKYRTRKLLTLCQLEQPACFIGDTPNEINKILAQIDRKKKYILKPVSNSGSHGVYLYNGADNTQIIKKMDQNDFPYIVEEFVTGDEYSIEILICHHEYHFLGITKKYLFDGTFIEQGHAFPANEILGQALSEQVFQQVKFACQCLGLTHGVIHAEFWHQSNKIILGEIHNRPGGGFISVMAAQTNGIKLYASQFADKIIKTDQRAKYMAVWAEKFPAIYPHKASIDNYLYAQLNHRNMFCTTGKTLLEALNNAKNIAQQSSV